MMIFGVGVAEPGRGEGWRWSDGPGECRCRLPEGWTRLLPEGWTRLLEKVADPAQSLKKWVVPKFGLQKFCDLCYFTFFYPYLVEIMNFWLCLSATCSLEQLSYVNVGDA